MKKVLIITGTLSFGGVERVVKDTAIALSKSSKYQPIVCSLLGGNALDNELKDAGIQYYCLNFYSTKNIVPNLLKVRKLIKQCRPDIIHTHQFASDFYGAIGSIGLHIPVISHLHNPQAESASRRIVRRILNHCFINAFIAVVEEKRIC
jgi:glycosyltransferase involved in cell wall biosynthesis